MCGFAARDLDRSLGRTQAPLALVQAVWDISTVIAVLFGVLFLKEKLNWRTAMSVFVTLSGTILLRASK